MADEPEAGGAPRKASLAVSDAVILGVCVAIVEGFAASFWSHWENPRLVLLGALGTLVALLVASGVAIYLAERRRRTTAYTVGAILRSRLPWVLLGTFVGFTLLASVIPAAALGWP